MNKNLIIVGIAVLFICVGLTGCEEEQEDLLSDLGYANYDYGFGFNPSEGWTENSTVATDVMSVVFHYLPEEDEYVMILFITKPDTLDIHQTLNNYSEHPDQNISQDLINYSLISKKQTIINGLDAIEYEFTYFNPGKNYTDKGKLVFIKKNSKVFEIGFEATITQYPRYISEVNESINSFTII